MTAVSREKQEALLQANLAEQAKIMAQVDLEKGLDQLNVQKTVNEQLIAKKSQMRDQLQECDHRLQSAQRQLLTEQVEFDKLSSQYKL